MIDLKKHWWLILIGLIFTFGMVRGNIRLFSFVLFIFLIVYAVIELYNRITNYNHIKSEDPNYLKMMDLKVEFGNKLKNLKLEQDDIFEELNIMKLTVLDKNISEENLRKTKSLILDFEEQLELRKTKIKFYKKSLEDLKKVEKNYLLAFDLKQKEDKIKSLKEGGFDSVSEISMAQSDVEFFDSYLNTVSNLDLQLESSSTVREADVIKIELEKIIMKR